jgi:hypothetical protein
MFEKHTKGELEKMHLSNNSVHRCIQGLSGDVEGGSYLCWPVHGPALHGDRCTAGYEAHTNSADEPVCLMADNVWNYEALLILWTVWRYYVSRQALRFMRGNLFMICQMWAAVIRSISHLFSVANSEKCGTSWCGILYSNVHFSVAPMYVKYGSARKCRRKLQSKFRDERVPSRQAIHNLVNKLRSTGHLIDSAYRRKVRWHRSQTWKWTYKIT